MSEKQCTKCGQSKPLDQFRVKRQSGGYSQTVAQCRVCEINAASDRQRRNKVGHRAYQAAYERRIAGTPIKVRADRKRNLNRYGITQGDYLAMLEAQGGGCAVCETDDPGTGLRHFHIDHCHTTGRVRGLLCSLCNRALGMLAEDAGRCEAMAAYIRSDTRAGVAPADGNLAGHRQTHRVA